MACAACASPSRRLVGPMTEACADRHDDIVDTLMGSLSDERKAEFDAHTRSCAGCAEAVRELSSVASRLHGSDVDLDAVERFDAPPAGLSARVTQAIEQARTEDSTVRQLEPRGRRARRISLAVLAAAVVLAVVTILGFRHSNPATHSEQVALAAKDTAPGASATAALRPQPYGIAIDLDVAGLDEGTVYALWLADASGTRSPAGTFVAGHDGTAAIDTSTALPRDRAVKIWITDPTDTTVLAAPLA
jgi:anti-sigma factor RsiW